MEVRDDLGDTIVSNSSWASFRPLGDTRTDRRMDTDDLGDTMASNSTWQSFRPLKDTFSVDRSARRYQSDDDLSVVSTIPELTRTQEVALRGSTRLKPVGEDFDFEDDRTSLDANLLQTTSFSVDIDATDFPGKRVSWPAEDNLASTLKSNRDSSEVLTASTREQTPRATAFGNRLMLRQSTVPGLESSRTVDSGNMQQNLAHTTRGLLSQINLEDSKKKPQEVTIGQFKQDSQTDNLKAGLGKRKLGETTRGNLRNYQWSDPDETNVMTVVGAETSDPDETNVMTVGGTDKNLGKTTRGLLREMSGGSQQFGPISASATETSDERERPPEAPMDCHEQLPVIKSLLRQDQTERTFEEQMERVEWHLEMEERRDKDITPCYRKGLVFLAVVMILIAAVVSVSVVIAKTKDDNNSTSKHGAVYTVEVTDPCPGVTVRLGELFILTCRFLDTHDEKRTTQSARGINVHPPNQVMQDIFKVVHDGTGHWTVTGPPARCSSEGQYTLVFVGFDGRDVKELQRVQIDLTIDDDIANNVHTKISQQVLDDSNRIEFTVKTSVANICRNYAVGLVGLRNQKDVNLNANSHCNSNYTDFDGYNIDCSNRILDTDTIFNAHYPVVRLSRGSINVDSDVMLPPCRPMPACTASCDDSTDIMEDACNSVDVPNCFDQTLPVFYQPNVCKLGWCSAPGGMVLKDLTLGGALCRDWTSSTMVSASTTAAINYDEETSQTSSTTNEPTFN